MSADLLVSGSITGNEYLRRDRFCYAAGQMELRRYTAFSVLDKKVITVIISPAVTGTLQMMFSAVTCQVLCY